VRVLVVEEHPDELLAWLAIEAFSLEHKLDSRKSAARATRPSRRQEDQVEDEGVCFLRAVLARIRDLASRAPVGE